MKLIAQGAEAKIYAGNTILKSRVKKGYRLPEIDNSLRRSRTRSEAKLLEKAGRLINVPRVLNVDDKKMTLELERIEGDKVRDVLTRDMCKDIGKAIRKLHSKDIIHGDLTTSNMIWNGKLFLIDFGLGKISLRIEDKAVDIHLFKECLKSRHYEHWVSYWNEFKKAYNQPKVFKQLERVEARARYKKVS
tara:strand:- start:6536 stop:7105 length:570 start_codon:yes stop_codon:yes gene_type:complete